MNEADIRFYNRVFEIGKRMKALEERLTKIEKMFDLLYGRDFEEGHRLKETA